MLDKTYLTGSAEDKILTCLKAAGWHKGRRVDMTKVRDFYSKGGIILPAGAVRFLREYHGLASGWYFNIPVEKQAGRAPDVTFSLFPNKGWETEQYFDERYKDVFDEDLKTISEYAGEPLVWVASIGYYYYDAVYMGSTGKIFTMRDDGEIRTYYSIVDMLSWDFEHHPNWEYVTVRHEP